jgi:hypothetical protein
VKLFATSNGKSAVAADESIREKGFFYSFNA